MGTLNILQDSCSVDEPPRKVQAVLDCVSHASWQGPGGDLQPYKLAEILGDISVFAAGLEARLPANSGVMKVLLNDDLFKTLVQKVCRWLGRAQAGKALLLHKSVDTLKASMTTACTAKEVSDFFNSDEILKCNSTAVHPVSLSLSDLPDQLLHIADAATPDQLQKLLAIAAQVVCGARCVAEDAASLIDFSFDFGEVSLQFRRRTWCLRFFTMQRDELRDPAELFRNALIPSPSVAGQRVSQTSMDGIIRVGTVCESVTTSW